MTTKFIMDNKLKEDMVLLNEVIKLTEKKPYPDKQTIHLAKFIDACFYGFEEAKKQELQEQEERKRKKQMLEFERIKKREDLQKKQALEAEAPSPPAQGLPPLDAPSPGLPPLMTDSPLEAPSPGLPPLLEDVPMPSLEVPSPNRKEYVIQIYSNPIGVFVDKENNAYTYHSIEPILEKSILDTAKSMYGKDLEKNPSLFHDSSFFQRLSEKVATRTKTTNSPMLTQKLLYYLQRDILGAGPFDPLLYDEKVKTIYCDGPNKNIKVEYDNLGQMNTNIIILENAIINQLLRRLAYAAGKKFDEKNPMLEITFQGLKFEALIGQGGTNTKVTIRRL